GSVRVLNLENRDFADIDKQEKGGILHFFSLLVCSKNAHVFAVGYRQVRIANLQYVMRKCFV
ncbi:hypothetical protein J7438_26355, partial [Thalassotalea sp. G20_0]|uniref:hypothetical protein n=1 Tax=Thalassotalea sp. G20_0 TaxID=2821093 RepID=UPI001ADAF491